jgi:hypothetical protein
MDDYLEGIKIQRILSWGNDISQEKLVEMLSRKIRVEKVAIKDVKCAPSSRQTPAVMKWYSTSTT